ncbi:hypothetical protein L249_5619 [Ophiocordyceps polyrhachis-furcata BCC 54312]|uniref:DUF4219 domain-containing protein n=1 Tax=Ophiocordyceps polyrhachis-furcata BCC 54312 TaxID=1330021 RepID=A0A367LG65_9HYPO|nr:hypothetical protein L249_5619 [Ophiocordyceps polyrhachis-furcata BCC 54312]
MPNTKKITFAKLSGGDNYTYWALRMDSLLIREKLQGALGSKTYNKSEKAGYSGRVIAVIAGVMGRDFEVSRKKYSFAKLLGSGNYTHWALRMDSLLIREKLQGALGSIAHNKSEDALALIRLQLEDGPLTQIMHLRSAKEAWDKLKDLYNPVSPKARHNALSHSGAIAVIAPESTRYSDPSTSSLLQYNHLSCLQFFFNPHKTTIT